MVSSEPRREEGELDSQYPCCYKGVSVNSSLSNAPRPGMGSGKELAQDSLYGAQVKTYAVREANWGIGESASLQSNPQIRSAQGQESRFHDGSPCYEPMSGESLPQGPRGRVLYGPYYSKRIEPLDEPLLVGPLLRSSSRRVRVVVPLKSPGSPSLCSQ